MPLSPLCIATMETMSPEEEPPIILDDDDNDGPGPPPEVLRDPKQQLSIPVYMETVIRNTAGCFVAYCLTYADLPSVIPPSQRWLIGLFTSLVISRIPSVAATFGVTLLGFYTLVTFITASATALLAAAAVSEGFFVAMFSLWTLWISGYAYGPTGKLFWVFVPVMVSFVGMMGLGLQKLVTDGITIQLSSDLLRSWLGDFDGTREGLEERLASINVTQLLEEYREEELIERAEGLLDGLGTYLPVILQALANLGQLLATGFLILVVPSGDFQGQEIELSLSGEDDQDVVLNVHIAGGIRLVKAFWTSSGLDNPMAVFQNFYVVVSWAIMCVAVSSLLPPLRTTRFIISRLVLPQTLRDAVWYMKGRNDDDDDDAVVRERLVAASNILAGGMPAIASGFEPRLFNLNLGKYPRCTFLTLKEVSEAVQGVALKALALRSVKIMHSDDAVATAIQECDEAATALATKTRQLGNKEAVRTTSSVPEVPRELDDPLGLRDASHRVTTATDAWLESLHPDNNDGMTLKDGVKNMGLNGILFVVPSILILGRLLQTLLLPALIPMGKYRWDLSKLIHCVKFTIGVTALISMSVYWDNYRRFEADSNTSDYSIAVVQGNPPKSFSGWTLVSARRVWNVLCPFVFAELI